MSPVEKLLLMFLKLISKLSSAGPHSLYAKLLLLIRGFLTNDFWSVG